MGNLVLKDVVRREFEDLKSDLNQGNVPKVAAQYQKQLNEMMNLPLNIAITGNAGVGKSSFVNAFRGVSDDDEEAAEVGKETLERKAYPHPSFPNIKIWDLPGIGTLKIKAAKYLKKVQFETYDVFIMVISERFTENDATLAKEIQKMNKKFYYVRSRIDVTISSEKRKRNFNEEDTLASIRRYCEDRLGEAVGVSSDVFLVSSREVHMYDFPLLQGKIAAELPDHKKDILTLSVHIFSENELMRKKEIHCRDQRATMGNNITKDQVCKEFEDLKRDLNQGSIPKVAAEYRKQLHEMQTLPLNIAVTGQTGSGKSSLVNAIRGVCDHDDEAAKVGIVEETMEPKAYPHPSFPNIQIWDLPGIGTPKFKAAEYLKTFHFETYDAFIIVASNRFTENDALLAKEIKKMRKNFYFVCTKIDISIEGEKRKRDFNMEKTLETLRSNYEDNLKRAGEPSAGIFLVSSWDVQKYDFPLLKETIAAELPDHKKHILILAVNMFSEDNLMKKKELMKSYIKKVSWVSFACGVVPVPGASIACDVGILIDALIHFSKVFGLNDRSLRFLASQTGKEFEELKSAIKKTPVAKKINPELIFSLLMKSVTWVTVTAVEIALDFIPVLGSVFGGASSYVVTYRFLNSFLDDVVEDARNVRAKFLK